jgi:D-alanyl-lipoteichoic acid acyltransferase DltB (MBOAT superfamily)
MQPLYDAQTYSYLMCLAILAACSLFYLAMRNSLTLLEAVFLSVAFTSLFTPVFAFYHVIEYALPLVVFLHLVSSHERLSRTNILIALISVLCLSALNINQPIVYPVSVFILSFIIIIQALVRGSMRWNNHLIAPLHF